MLCAATKVSCNPTVLVSSLMLVASLQRKTLFSFFFSLLLCGSLPRKIIFCTLFHFSVSKSWPVLGLFLFIIFIEVLIH